MAVNRASRVPAGVARVEVEPTDLALRSPRITLRQLSAFVAVARTGSIVRASAAVGLSQSALSLSVRELEQNLGAKVFRRVSRRLVLNDFGRHIFPAAQSLVRRALDLQESAVGGPLHGVLRVGATHTVADHVLPRAAGAYVRENPRVRVEVEAGSSLAVIDAVEGMKIDIGFIEGPCNRSTIAVTPWLRDEMVFFVARGHPLAKLKSVTVRRLADYLWPSQPLDYESRLQIANAVAKYLPPGTVDRRYQTSSIEGIKHAVETSGGVGCLSRLALERDFKARRFVALNVRSLRLARTFSIIQRKEAYREELQEAFIAYMRSYFSV